MQTTKNILSKTLVIVLLCLATAVTAYSQDNNQIKLTNGHYYYQDKQYELQDLETIFHEQTEASLLYMQGIQKRKAAKELGAVSLTSFGFGIIPFLKIKKATSISNVVTLGVLGLVLTGTGAVCGLISLSKREKSTKHMNDAINAFNKNPPSLSNHSNLDIKITTSGVGLVLNF